MRTHLLAAALALATACGIDPAKIPTTQVYERDGAAVSAPERISFAVVGATRVPLTARGEPEIPKAAIADVAREARARGLTFAVLTGNYVGRSTTGEWAAFAERWGDVLRGETINDGQPRVSVLALPGAGEILGDPDLSGYGAAFPGAGADIGFGRVATWSHLDATVGGKTWRLVFLDTHRGAMGSRWDEQLYWLPKVVGEGFDQLVVFLPDPLITLGRGVPMDKDDAPSELIDTVEAHSDLMKLVAVISGGGATNELLLPGGAWGEAYVVAGNAGVPSTTLALSGSGAEVGVDPLTLEPAFQGMLQAEMTRWPLSEKAAAAEGEIPAELPVQGWWIVDLGARELRATFRMRRADGGFADVYQARWTKKGGWAAAAL